MCLVILPRIADALADNYFLKFNNVALQPEGMKLTQPINVDLFIAIKHCRR